MKKIKKLILIPNTEKNISRETLGDIVDHLISLGAEIYAFQREAAVMSDWIDKITVLDSSADPSLCDAMLVLGGDGSMIEAARRAVTAEIPIVGINFGHVGFLTALESGEYLLIDRLFDGEYTIDDRMMLNAVVTRADGSVKAEYTVLNDIVLTNGPAARMITFDVNCNGVSVQTVRADGAIVSTPTGSTAYSLSAGGPILDPGLEAVCFTPICPHTLSSRPIIFDGAAEITVLNVRNNNSEVYLNADGRDAVKIDEGDTITIRQSAYKTKLIRIKDAGFISTLHTKLAEK